VKILVMGLPGSGKTTLAKAVAQKLQCPHFNADDIRQNVNKDLGFSLPDRIEQARRIGYLCDVVGQWGQHVIADMVCPTEETREAFNADILVWVDRIKESRFVDTNEMFQPPKQYDIRVTTECDDLAYCVDSIIAKIGQH
jgi:adenylylsulfate kinase